MWSRHSPRGVRTTPDRVWLLANGRSQDALEAKPGEPGNDVGIVDANAAVDYLLQAPAIRIRLYESKNTGSSTSLLA